MEKDPLFGKTLAQLKEICAEAGMPSFTAGQIALWLYQHRVEDFSRMTNLSARNREFLEEHFVVGRRDPVEVHESQDGTKKYLFETTERKYIETAYIPDKDRATLCVSSQSGCRMGCRFCMTARQGFQQQLTGGEIINQVLSIPETESLTNIVYMGMGEPLDNLDEVLNSIAILTSPWGLGWSPSRITVSTIGVVPAMRELLEKTKVNLAVSLHNPFSLERREMMPVENKYSVSEIMGELRRHEFNQHRRISFEYIVFEGLNDSPRHIKELKKLLQGLKCRINLIRFHRIPDAPYRGANLDTLTRFRDELTKAGIITTIRSSRGEDIQAACGLLSTLNKLQ